MLPGLTSSSQHHAMPDAQAMMVTSGLFGPLDILDSAPLQVATFPPQAPTTPS